MREQVYIVRLTECELDELKEICSPEMNEATLRHARPEHPERQATLKAVADAASAYFNGLNTSKATRLWEHLADAEAAYRSLEGK